MESVVGQKVSVGPMLYGHGNGTSAECAKMTIVVFLRLVFVQGGRETDGVVVGGDCDESFVERLVVERRKADTILGVKSLLWCAVCPRDDMSRDEQLGDVDTGNGATSFVIEQYHRAENILVDTLVDDSSSFLAFQVAGGEIQGFFDGLVQKFGFDAFRLDE